MAPGQVIAAVAVSLDGFIAGPDDGPEQGLGAGGEQLFTWFGDGDTASRFYPWMAMSAISAAAFDGFIDRIGAVITGRRTYDITNGWDGEGEVPGAPLFVVTHRAPDRVPPADPPYTFVTDGIASAVRQALAAANGKGRAPHGSIDHPPVPAGRPAQRAHHRTGPRHPRPRCQPARRTGPRHRQPRSHPGRRRARRNAPDLPRHQVAQRRGRAQNTPCTQKAR
jgi:dihydrofolate reductase